MATRHFLSLTDLDSSELQQLIKRAIELKIQHKAGGQHRPFIGKMLGMVFEKSSTRTRVSFESAMFHLGGQTTFLSPRDTQLGRGEPIEDTARVMSRMLDGIVVRANRHDMLETFAKYSTVPIINALTNRFHPCQLLADIQTYVEHRGSIQGRKVTWIGDGNNMCQSYMKAAMAFDFELVIACPPNYKPEPELLASTSRHVNIIHDPHAACAQSDLIVTDVWASMGHEAETQQRISDFKEYQVTEKLLSRAKKDVLFMHCLPAHRGEEVSTQVLEGPHSVVWDEAENRLHSQKALLELLLTPQTESGSYAI